VANPGVSGRYDRLLKRKGLIFLFLIPTSIFFFLLLKPDQKSDEDWYEKIDDSVLPKRIQQQGHDLSSSPHRAGTESNKKVGDQILQLLSEYGLKTSTEEYSIDFPEPEDSQLQLIFPEQVEFNLHERQFSEDPSSKIAKSELPFLAFSPDADIQAKVIYANTGSADDYAYLKSRGLDLSNSIALVRARGICRSMKIAAAEKEGIAGLLIYPELKDQGFRKAEFPYGPHLNPWVTQRGSLLKYYLYPGDPTEPEAQSLSTLPKIPALPISQKIASALLKNISGESVPESWQGWLPEGYHTGPGPALVKMIYRGTKHRRTIRNIFAWLDTRTNEQQFTIAGNHYDAWVYGAADPISGTTVLLEAAKVLSNLSHKGWSPRRKILFTFWDAEEYGMFGSTAWVKKNLSLLENAVAYINVDTAFRARDLSAYIYPGLYGSMDRALIGLQDPDSGRYFSEIRPEYQNPGFSSDVAPFLRFAGVPVLEVGFGRTYSVYHSLYDDEMWLEKFGDPDAKYRAALSKIMSRYLFRISSDALLPYDFTEIQPYVNKALDTILKGREIGSLESEIEELRKELDLFHAAALRVQKQTENQSLSSESLVATNEFLLKAMLAFNDTNSYHKSVLLESSSTLGCAGEALSEMSEAFRSNNPEQIRTAIKNLTGAFSKSRQFLEKIGGILKSK
jgi:N-acetylated-alpha-linked acidic dipeptidase